MKTSLFERRPRVSTDLSSEEKWEDNEEANTAMTRAPQKRTQSRKHLHPDLNVKLLRVFQIAKSFLADKCLQKSMDYHVILPSKHFFTKHFYKLEIVAPHRRAAQLDLLPCNCSIPDVPTIPTHPSLPLSL
ncbi:hypothetical protein EB796_018173 [Bugula neritina]|uniref:Uncharacterized protein n=1 Tax=Bugula neritina TaxID=10212 RepID=A0A7J7JBS0_BUGNE|nr:hypothetical protein EB796_018173 [Bugula neritina]